MPLRFLPLPPPLCNLFCVGYGMPMHGGYSVGPSYGLAYSHDGSMVPAGPAMSSGGMGAGATGMGMRPASTSPPPSPVFSSKSAFSRCVMTRLNCCDGGCGCRVRGVGGGEGFGGGNC
jgi:hypothetical protein